MSAWLPDIQRLRREVDEKLRQLVAGIIGWTLTANTSAAGEKDAVENADDAQDPGSTTKSERQATRVLPWGLQGRPPKGLRSLWFKFGSSNVVFIGIAPQQKYGPGNLNQGETALYNSISGTTVLLDQNGNIQINAGSNADVTINGGTAKVGRVGDSTAGHTHTAGTLMCPNTGTGTPVAVTGSTASATDTINQGAPHFKA